MKPTEEIKTTFNIELSEEFTDFINDHVVFKITKKHRTEDCQIPSSHIEEMFDSLHGTWKT